MRASSSAPMSPRRAVGSELRWIGDDVGAARAARRGSTASAPCSAARSAVRFWLQAITSIPNAWPIRATGAPEPAEAERRRACGPARSVPTRLLPAAARGSRRSSAGTCRASGEDQRPGQLGGRGGQRRRCRETTMPRSLRGRDVDRRVAHAGGDEQPEVRQPLEDARAGTACARASRRRRRTARAARRARRRPRRGRGTTTSASRRGRPSPPARSATSW